MNYDYHFKLIDVFVFDEQPRKRKIQCTIINKLLNK